jgi:S-adenosylmethionine:tRNA ribosyltransferase-isomerase
MNPQDHLSHPDLQTVTLPSSAHEGVQEAEQKCTLVEQDMSLNATEAGDDRSTSAASDYDLSAYHYTLPPDRIAQNPVEPRDRSRLLVVRAGEQESHHIFRELPDLLRPGDLLVLNNTKVFPARLYGHKASGAEVEVLLLEPLPNDRWLALVKPGRRLQPGTILWFGERGFSDSEANNIDSPIVKAIILDRDEATGGRILQFELIQGQNLSDALAKLGQMPLPPYITASQADPSQYQTVYAQYAGSVAAPTAGLHFTPELLSRLGDRGIQSTAITLHVGVGTFRPVNVSNIRDHTMHAEWVEVPAATVQHIQQAQAQGGRVIAVGTTTVRSLEGAAQTGTLQPFCGKTNLFIYPGYQWRVVQGLITNFHLPGSSLMMLVSALIGRQRLLDLYQLAISQGYRFYSFGDAMLILPDARINSGS